MRSDPARMERLAGLTSATYNGMCWGTTPIQRGAMFDHKHYVPFLKGKRAEFPAIGRLGSKDGVTPLFEAVPSLPADFVPSKMEAAWERDRPYFIDLLFLDDEDMSEGDAGGHPLRACFDAVRAR